MTIFLQAFGLLCGLACVVFATAVSSRRLDLVLMTLGFVATVVRSALWTDPQDPPDPAWVGLVVVAVATLGLLRPGLRIPLAAGAGVLGGLWTVFLQTQGLPWVLALLVPVASLGIAVFASRRPDFATPSIRDEALLLVCCLGLLVALGPELLAGWRSAAVLNAASVPSQAMEGWVLVVGAASVVAGGLTALARER